MNCVARLVVKTYMEIKMSLFLKEVEVEVMYSHQFLLILKITTNIFNIQNKVLDLEVVLFILKHSNSTFMEKLMFQEDSHSKISHI